MMRIKNILMAVAVVLAALSCSDRYELEGLRTQSGLYELNSTGGSTPVVVYAGGDWKAWLTEQVSWASIDRSSGNGVGQVVFTYSDNAGIARKVGIVIECEGQRDTVDMRQAAGLSSVSIRFADAEVSVPGCSGRLVLPYETNVGEQAEDLQLRVEYGGDVETEWISNLSLEDGTLTFDVASYADAVIDRNVKLTLYITDAAGEEFSGSAVLVQTAEEPKLELDASRFGASGGEVALSVKSTNLGPYLSAVAGNAVFDFGSEEAWASVSPEKCTATSFFMILEENGSGGERTCTVSPAYTDLDGRTWTFGPVAFSQLGPPCRYEDLKALVAGTEGEYRITDASLYIEAVVIGDKDNANMDNNPNLSETEIDYGFNDKVNYIQSDDASSGFRIVTATAEDNVMDRYDRIALSLEGLTLVKSSDPERYTLSGVTKDHLLSQSGGSETAVKTKTLTELTDADVYTYVTITGLEVAFKSGAWTNGLDGYQKKITASDAVNPENEGINPKGNSAPVVYDATPLLLRDASGKQIRMVTNNATPWRRYGNGVLHGTCSFSGIITHHDMPRWAKDGDIGRYSVRVLEEEDIVQTGERFSSVVVAWMWDGKHKSVAPTWPADADTDICTITNNFGVKPEYGTNDYNNVSNTNTGTVSNAVLYLKKDGMFWGSSDATDMDAAPWVQITFSTEGLSGSNLVFNWTVGGGNQSLDYIYYPADWHVEYSTDGNSFTSCSEDYAVHPIVWNNDKVGLCPLWAVGGLHEYSTVLPASLLGQPKVWIRVKASTNKCCEKANPVTSRDGGTVASYVKGGRIRFGEISVEYN